jgi:hypothetical protein
LPVLPVRYYAADQGMPPGNQFRHVSRLLPPENAERQLAGAVKGAIPLAKLRWKSALHLLRGLD